MQYIRNFTELDRNDVPFAGGKGASLGEMTQAGIPVPPGFVVLSVAFERFLEETGLAQEIASLLGSVDPKDMRTVKSASRKIMSLIHGEEMPADMAAQILRHFKGLHARFVAVRSSATAEDSSTASWAGQLESYLNTAKGKLLENVKRCWASLFTPRAIFYRFEKSLHTQKISVAVVVQKMVESECAGIGFSVHPVTQDRNRIIIEAGFGLGEAVVGGKITPDSYIVERKGWKIVEKNIALQEKMLVRGGSAGNRWADLKEEKGRQQVLSDREIGELARLIVRIEAHYGFPVDVEFAREKGKFYIVQSRPITSLTRPLKGVPDIGSVSDYQRLFQNPSSGYILSSLFMYGYRNLDALAIFRNKVWTSYLPKAIMEKTLKEGLELYSNERKLQAFKKEYLDYMKSSGRFFTKILKKKRLVRTDVEKAVSLIRKNNDFYPKTEFFYTDLAFLNAGKDQKLRKNLRSFGNFKLTGKRYLNKLLFSGKGYFSSLMKKLSSQFRIPLDVLYLYDAEELPRLFEGIRLSESGLKERKMAYVAKGKQGNVEVVFGEKARSIIESFAVSSKAGLLRGQVANPGRAKGRARVFINSLLEFDDIHRLISRMEKGEVLVAETTSPEIIPACKKAVAIVTNQGGLLSHAAIVSRELGIPCIVGTGNATELIRNGDLIEVDADTGRIRILKRQRK